MRRSHYTMMIGALALMSAPSIMGPTTYYSDHRFRRIRKQDQSPRAQKARKNRKKKRLHSKRYNRHYTPKMST